MAWRRQTTTTMDPTFGGLETSRKLPCGHRTWRWASKPVSPWGSKSHRLGNGNHWWHRACLERPMRTADDLLMKYFLGRGWSRYSLAAGCEHSSSMFWGLQIARLPFWEWRGYQVFDPCTLWTINTTLNMDHGMLLLGTGILHLGTYNSSGENHWTGYH